MSRFPRLYLTSPDGKPDVEPEEEPETYGPTRFAKKYIQKQPLELQTIIYAIIKGLSSSVTYHSNREATKYLELRQSKEPDWKVWIVSQPKKMIIEIIFYAEAGDTITDDGSETYADKLEEFKCPQLAEKYPFPLWEDEDYDDYLNCQLNPDSNEDKIESVRSAINWFLLESYK